MTSDQKEKAQEVVVPVIIVAQIASMTSVIPVRRIGWCTMVTIMKKLINKLAGFIFNLIGLPYYVAKEIIKWTVVGINKLIDVIKLIIKVLVDGVTIVIDILVKFI